MLRVLFAVILLLPLPLYANESNTTTTTTTVPSTTTTTIPGEVEEVETFDGPLEEEVQLQFLKNRNNYYNHHNYS